MTVCENTVNADKGREKRYQGETEPAAVKAC